MQQDAKQSAGSDGADGHGPRVTMAEIEQAITAEHYFTAADGAFGAAMRIDGTAPPPADHTPLALTTFCVLELDNGFTVEGQSACVSRHNFNARLGREYARSDAVRRLWHLLGFRLADRIRHGAVTISGQRLSSDELAVIAKPNGQVVSTDAYEGARDDLLIWKGRAQRAEARLAELGEEGWQA